MPDCFFWRLKNSGSEQYFSCLSLYFEQYPFEPEHLVLNRIGLPAEKLFETEQFAAKPSASEQNGFCWGAVRRSVAQDSSKQSSNLKQSSDKETSSKQSDKNSVEFLNQQYANDMKQLAEECQKKGMVFEENLTRQYIFPESDYECFIPNIPVQPLPKILPDDATDEQQLWFAKFRDIRETYAQKIYDKAKQEAAQKNGGQAIYLCFLALHAYPDYPPVRRVLGFSLFKNEWRTGWEIEQLKKGYIEHEKFGWILKKYVARYERGERLLLNGSWGTPEEDAQMRTSISKGWSVESEHYVLRTTLSREDGVRRIRELEEVYRVWKQCFFRLTATDEELSALFSSKKIPSAPRRHKVVYFKSREEYLRELIRYEKDIEKSYGGYFPHVETFFFYKEESEDTRKTLIHEATHQLFRETRPIPKSFVEGKDANFWAVEGIATYMETLRTEGNYHIIGGVRTFRFQKAKERCLEENDGYIPMRDLCKMGRSDFQAYPELPKLYTQSMGMASFFMHANGGAYRTKFVKYLYQIYSGTASVNGALEILLDKRFEQFDLEYREFMEKTPPIPSSEMY